MQKSQGGQVSSQEIPAVVKENLTNFIKLYIKWGADSTNIMLEFQLIVEEKIDRRFIVSFCYDLNRKTYRIIVDYLKEHQEEKGQKNIQYNYLWPEAKDMTPHLKRAILDIPRTILRKQNKDLSEAHNLLFESLANPSLIGLIRYEKIRDLYQFITEIIVDKKISQKQLEQQNKDEKKKISSQVAKNDFTVPKGVDSRNFQAKFWSQEEEFFLCTLYLNCPLFKCVQKLREKYGRKQKWSTTKKVYNKASQIFQRELKVLAKTENIKEIFKSAKQSRQTLLGKLVFKRNLEIQRSVLKYFRTENAQKRRDLMKQLSGNIVNFFNLNDDGSLYESIQHLKKEEHKEKCENILKQEEHQQTAEKQAGLTRPKKQTIKKKRGNKKLKTNPFEQKCNEAEQEQAKIDNVQAEAR